MGLAMSGGFYLVLPTISKVTCKLPEYGVIWFQTSMVEYTFAIWRFQKSRSGLQDFFMLIHWSMSWMKLLPGVPGLTSDSSLVGGWWYNLVKDMGLVGDIVMI